MFTSAAPQDPTFWPLHGNAERYTQLLRILDAQGIIDYSDEWGYDHTSGVASDTHVVCDWDGTSSHSGADVMPKCVKDVCPGHTEYDLLPFMDLYVGQTSLYSNKDFYDLVSPYNEELPYAYDSIETWKGCKDDSMLVEAGLA